MALLLTHFSTLRRPYYEYHVGLNNKHLFSPSSGTLKFKFPAGLVPGESSFPSLQMTIFLLCPHMGKGEGRGRESVLSGSFLIRRLVMLYQGPTLTTTSLSLSLSTVTFRDEGFDIGF